MAHSCVNILAALSLMRLKRVTVAVTWIVAFLTIAVQAEADGPPIVRVRVPAKDVSKWFTVGTELRVMPALEFDALVAGVRNRSSARGPPHLRA